MDYPVSAIVALAGIARLRQGTDRPDTATPRHSIDLSATAKTTDSAAPSMSKRQDVTCKKAED
jgi:hypothetical protein